MKPSNLHNKVLNFLLIVTSLLGYLEWGKDNRSFLFQIEGELLYKLFSATESVMHPFILLPLLGQVLLAITLFQRKPSKTLTYSGIICLALLLGFVCFIGFFALNYKMLISTLPFIFIALFTIRSRKR